MKSRRLGFDHPGGEMLVATSKIVFSALLLMLAAGCSSPSTATRRESKSGTSEDFSSDSVVQRPREQGITPDDDYTKGIVATAISGTNLTSTQPVCTTKRNIQTKASSLECRAGIATKDSTGKAVVIAADDLEAGLEVDWTLVRKFGEFNGAYNCEKKDKGVRYVCEWQSDTNIAVKADVGLAIRSSTATHRAKPERISFQNECEGLNAETRYDAFGDGTAKYPYLWCFSEQLVDFANNRCNEESTDTSGCAAHIRVGRDLDGAKVTKPIGSGHHPYIGHFYGNGYSISNITLSSFSLGIFNHLGANGVLDHFTIRSARIDTGAAGGLLVGTTDEGSEIRHVAVVNSSLKVGFAGGNIGGIVGYMLGKLKYSYANIDIVANAGYAGALVGYTGKTGEIVESFAEGSLTDTATSQPEHDISTVYTGGLVGLHSGSLTDSYAIIKLTATYGMYGGLVGQMDGGSITRSYAAGAIKMQAQSVVGGIAGAVFNSNSHSSYSSTYWDIETTGLNVAIGQSSEQTPGLPGLFGRTTAQMQAAETFVGWDFEKVWQIKPGSYPTLRNVMP